MGMDKYMNGDSIENITEKWEKRVFGLRILGIVAVVVVAAAILSSLMYIIRLQFQTNEPTYQLAAEICNTYTGIILGFVAMAVSLISIILSFYNTIQAEKSNIESIRQFNESINLSKKMIEDLKPISEKLPQLIDFQDKNTSTLKEIQATLDSIKIKSQNGEIVLGEPQQVTDESFDDK